MAGRLCALPSGVTALHGKLRTDLRARIDEEATIGRPGSARGHSRRRCALGGPPSERHSEQPRHIPIQCRHRNRGAVGRPRRGAPHVEALAPAGTRVHRVEGHDVESRACAAHHGERDPPTVGRDRRRADKTRAPEAVHISVAAPSASFQIPSCPPFDATNRSAVRCRGVAIGRRQSEAQCGSTVGQLLFLDRGRRPPQARLPPGRCQHEPAVRPRWPRANCSARRPA